MSLFHNLLAQGGRAFFVSDAGTGSGFTAADSMSIADFEIATVANGDRVYFNAGDEFILGDFDISGTVVVGRYGAGANPILTGAESISGLVWTAEGGDIYSAPMAVEPKWVWIAGECATMAQTARITISARGGLQQATVSHAAVSGYTSIVGSYLTLKEKNFKNSQRVTVTGYNGAGVITFDGPIPTTNNVDLVLLNNTEYLTGNNQWAWEAGTLYVRAAASPSTLDIKAGSYTYGIKTTGSITVSNIEFKEYYTAALWCNGGKPVVSDCNFHDIRDTAVLIQRKVAAPSVTDCTFTRIGNIGVFSRPCDNLIISGNTFTDIALQGNYNWQTWNDGDGSIAVNNVHGGGTAVMYVIDLDDDTLDGTSCTVELNTVTNCAFNCFSFHVGTANTFTKNVMSGHMQRYADGGAIYTFHYRDYNIPTANNVISYNIIDGEGRADARGIYCDNRTFAANVHHNTVQGCSYGIRLSADSSDHTVEDNNCFNNTYGVVFTTGDTAATNLYSENTNNQFNRNVIVSYMGQKALWFEVIGSYPVWNPYGGTGGADNNTYIKNMPPDAGAVYDNDNEGTNRTLAQLQAAFGEDAASVKLLNENADLIINPTNATSNEDADSYFKDLAGTTLTTYTIAAFYSRIVLQVKNSMQFVAASSNYLSASSTPDISQDTTGFSFSFWFKFASNPGTAQPILTKLDGAGKGYNFVINTTGTLGANFVNTTGTNRLTMVTTIDVADNAWHHALITRNATASASTIYIDGVDRTSITGNNLTLGIQTTAPLYLGSNASQTNFLDGFIDHLDYWVGSQVANVATIYASGRVQDFRYQLKSRHSWNLGRPLSLVDVGNSTEALINFTNNNSTASSTDVP